MGVDLQILATVSFKVSFAQLKSLQNLGYWRVGVDVFLNYVIKMGGEGMLRAENGFFRNV